MKFGGGEENTMSRTLSANEFSERQRSVLALFKTILDFALGPPSPSGSQGRVRIAILLQEIIGPIPARIRGVLQF